MNVVGAVAAFGLAVWFFSQGVSSATSLVKNWKPQIPMNNSAAVAAVVVARLFMVVVTVGLIAMAAFWTSLAYRVH